MNIKIKKRDRISPTRKVNAGDVKVVENISDEEFRALRKKLMTS